MFYIHLVYIWGCIDHPSPFYPRYLVLVFDEMKIKGLVYHKHTGQVVGFTHLGDVNADLETFERRVNGMADADEPTMATHMLSLTIRGRLINISAYYRVQYKLIDCFSLLYTGVFTTLEYPYAHFQTTGITGQELYPIVSGREFGI